MPRWARSLASKLTTRRFLKLVGLAYWSDMDLRHRAAEDFRSRMWRAQEALEQTKRLRFVEREQFRQAMKIRGANMEQFYQVSIEDVSRPTVKTFRFNLHPLTYSLEHAYLDGAIYHILAVREAFAEDTATRFATYIRTHMPAEIVKQLEAQL
jgi:hypothetical protein